MIRANQPGSQPLDIPETIPNPVVVPTKPAPAKPPEPREPVKVPERAPAQEFCLSLASRDQVSRIPRLYRLAI
jgi:hypothetical protein